MLYTISWMVRRERPAAYAAVERDVIASFLAGGLVGGSVAGALVAVLARGIFIAIGTHQSIVGAVCALLAFSYAGAAARIWHLPVPQLKSQVPAAWRNIFSPKVASFLYSAGLGMFFFTRLGSAVALPLTAYALGLGYKPVAIVLIFAAAGLIRAATAMVLPFARLHDENDVRQFMSSIGPALPYAEACALLLVAVIAVICTIRG